MSVPENVWKALFKMSVSENVWKTLFKILHLKKYLIKTNKPHSKIFEKYE